MSRTVAEVGREDGSVVAGRCRQRNVVLANVVGDVIKLLLAYDNFKGKVVKTWRDALSFRRVRLPLLSRFYPVPSADLRHASSASVEPSEITFLYYSADI